MLLSEALTDYIYEEDSSVAQQAKKMGLVYKGFGRWADAQTNKITHRTDNGRLVPVDPTQTSLSLGDPKKEPMKGQPGSMRDRPADPRAKGFSKQPPPEELGSQQEKAKEFSNLLQRHDWSYNYSDDHTMWKRGRDSEDQIKDFIQNSGIHPKVAKAVWDKFAPQDANAKAFGLDSPSDGGDIDYGQVNTKVLMAKMRDILKQYKQAKQTGDEGLAQSALDTYKKIRLQVMKSIQQKRNQHRQQLLQKMKDKGKNN